MCVPLFSVGSEDLFFPRRQDPIIPTEKSLNIREAHRFPWFSRG